MQYRLLITGKNTLVIDDFFYNMTSQFECQTVSDRPDDMECHDKYYRPDALVYCMNDEGKEGFTRFVNSARKINNDGLSVVIIGRHMECEEFQKFSRNLAELVIEMPKSSIVIQKMIMDLIDQTGGRKEAPKKSGGVSQSSADMRLDALDSLIESMQKDVFGDLQSQNIFGAAPTQPVQPMQQQAMQAAQAAPPPPKSRFGDAGKIQELREKKAQEKREQLAMDRFKDEMRKKRTEEMRKLYEMERNGEVSREFVENFGIVSKMNDSLQMEQPQQAKQPVQQTVQQMPAFPRVRPEGTRGHVLVVDDDPRMLRLIKEELRDKYDVATAINGKLAMKFLENKHTDLILLDYEMPVENGPMVLRKLRDREETRNIPVIFLTGINDKDKIQTALAMKPQGYILKPIDLKKLYAAIQNVIG